MRISEATGRIYAIRSSMELSRLVVEERDGRLPICPIWACTWAKNMSNLGGWGLGAFLRWWPPSATWAGPLIFLATTGDVWMTLSFRIWDCVLHVEQPPVPRVWVVFGGFSKVVATFNLQPLIFLWPPLGCLNNPFSLNLGLCAARWAHFMCHHELWPTSVCHPFSSLNSSLGLTRGKYYLS